MTEPLIENEHPINQISKKLLIEVSKRPDPNCQYCLQLMLWGLEDGAFKFTARWMRSIIEENLYSLLAQSSFYHPNGKLNHEDDRKVVLWFLLRNPEDTNNIDADCIKAEELLGATPLEAAEKMLVEGLIPVLQVRGQWN